MRSRSSKGMNLYTLHVGNFDVVIMRWVSNCVSRRAWSFRLYAHSDLFVRPFVVLVFYCPKVLLDH